MSAQNSYFGQIGNLKQRKRKERIFYYICLCATIIGVLLLALLLYSILRDGLTRLNWSFLQNFTSRFADRAGIRASLFGTLWVISLTTLIAVPIGIAAAVFLEEFAKSIRIPGSLRWKMNGKERRVEFQSLFERLTGFIQLNIANLAGVPSIVYGLLGLTLFVRWLAMGRSVLAGALTMSLLILPTVIIATQEAIRAVPNSLREASYGLGATHWQTISRQVLPTALPSILTGIILAVSRAIGETAPLITIGAATFITFTPTSVNDPFTVLPIQIFDWASRPQEAFQRASAAAIIVLLVVLLCMNSLAIFLRYRARKNQTS
jgi:phosphate transport system permease protein